MGIMRMKIHMLRQSNGSKSRGDDGLLNVRSSKCLVSSVYYPIHLDLTRKSIVLKDTSKDDDSSMIGDYCAKSSINLWLFGSYDVLIRVAHFYCRKPNLRIYIWCDILPGGRINYFGNDFEYLVWSYRTL